MAGVISWRLMGAMFMGFVLLGAGFIRWWRICVGGLRLIRGAGIVTGLLWIIVMGIGLGVF
jgi:hypothetical protein